jgi:septal ring factor EnvC (AmiA/AmiB activator)
VDDTDAYEHLAMLRERITRAETTLQKVEKEVTEVTAKLDALLSKLDRYEGKLGGVLIAAAAFIAFFKFVFTQGFEWLHKIMGV